MTIWEECAAKAASPRKKAGPYKSDGVPRQVPLFMIASPLADRWKPLPLPGADLALIWR
jgi:hypothetical protein